MPPPPPSPPLALRQRKNDTLSIAMALSLPALCKKAWSLLSVEEKHRGKRNVVHDMGPEIEYFEDASSEAISHCLVAMTHKYANNSASFTVAELRTKLLTNAVKELHDHLSSIAVKPSRKRSHVKWLTTETSVPNSIAECAHTGKWDELQNELVKLIHKENLKTEEINILLTALTCVLLLSTSSDNQLACRVFVEAFQQLLSVHNRTPGPLHDLITPMLHIISFVRLPASLCAQLLKMLVQVSIPHVALREETINFSVDEEIHNTNSSDSAWESFTDYLYGSQIIVEIGRVRNCKELQFIYVTPNGEWQVIPAVPNKKMTFGCGSVFIRAEAENSASKADLKVTVSLTINLSLIVGAAEEFVCSLANASIACSSSALESRPEKGFPQILRGGLNDKEFPSLAQEILHNPEHELFQKVRCRSQDVPAARSYMVVVAHHLQLRSLDAERLSKLINKSGLLGDAIPPAHCCELAQLILRTVPITSCDFLVPEAQVYDEAATLFHDYSVAKLESQFFERLSFAETFQAVLQVFELLVVPLCEMNAAQGLVSFFCDYSENRHYLDSVRGCGMSVEKRIRCHIYDFLGKLFHVVQGIASMRTLTMHRFVRDEMPQGAFVLACLRLLTAPFDDEDMRVVRHLVGDVVTSFLPIATNIGKTTSFLIDEEQENDTLLQWLAMSKLWHIGNIFQKNRFSEKNIKLSGTPSKALQTLKLFPESQSAVYFEIEIVQRKAGTNGFLGLVPPSIEMLKPACAPGCIFVLYEGIVMYCDKEGNEMNHQFVSFRQGDTLGLSLQVSDRGKRALVFRNGMLFAAIPLFLTDEELTPILGGDSDVQVTWNFGPQFHFSPLAYHPSVHPYPTTHFISVMAGHLIYRCLQGCQESVSDPSSVGFVDHVMKLLLRNMDQLFEALTIEIDDMSATDRVKCATLKTVGEHTIYTHLCILRVGLCATSEKPLAVSTLSQIACSDKMPARIRCASLALLDVVLGGPFDRCLVDQSIPLTERLLDMCTNEVNDPCYTPYFVTNRISPHGFLNADGSVLSIVEGANSVVGFGTVIPSEGVTEFSVRVTRGDLTTLGHLYYIGVGPDIEPAAHASFFASYSEGKPLHLDRASRFYILPDNGSETTPHLNSIELQRHRSNWYDPSGEVYGPGDIVTVRVNQEKHNIAFFRNELPLGTLFSGVDSQPLFPFVAIYNQEASAHLLPVKPHGFSELQLRTQDVLRKLLLHGSAKVVELLLQLARTNSIFLLQIFGSDGDGRNVIVRSTKEKGTVIHVVNQMATVRTARAVKTVVLSDLVPDYSAIAPVKLPGQVVQVLVELVLETMTIEDQSVLIASPSVALRVLRVLSFATRSDIGQESLILLEALLQKVLFCEVSTIDDVADTVQKCWEALPKLGENARLQCYSPVETVFRGLCMRCQQSYFDEGDCEHYFPLTEREMMFYGDSTYKPLSTEWKGDKLVMTLELEGAVVTGAGECTQGFFTVEGTFEDSHRLNLMLSFFSADECDAAKAVPTEWACQACTFLNGPDVARCAMCMTPKEGGIWTCERCTYAYNNIGTDCCAMCGSSKPQTKLKQNPPKSARCDECKTTTSEYDDFFSFSARQFCQKCHTQTTFVPTTLERMMFSAVLTEKGDEICGKLRIGGNECEIHLLCEPHVKKADNQETQWLKPIPNPRAVEPAKCQLILHNTCRIMASLCLCQWGSTTGNCFWIGNIISSSSALCSLFSKLVNKCDVLKQVLSQATSALQLRDSILYLTELAFSENLLPPNALLYTLLFAFNVASESQRKRVAKAMALIMEDPRASPLLMSKLMTFPDCEQVALCCLLKGGEMANPPLRMVALFAMVASYQAMTNKQPVPAILDDDVNSLCGDLVQLRDTTMSSGGKLLIGQVRGTTALSVSDGGKYYFEVVKPANGTAVVGWGTVRHGVENPMEFVGSDMYSWGYDLKASLRVFQSTQEYVPPALLKPGDVVGCLLNLDNKKMCFSLNGVLMEWIDIPSFSGESLYLYVSANTGREGIEVRLNRTQHKPEGYHEMRRSVADSNFSRKCSCIAPQSFDFYLSLAKLVNELCGSVSLSSILSPDDTSWTEPCNKLVCNFPAIRDMLPTSHHVDDTLKLRPYVAHLSAISELSVVANKHSDTLRNTWMWKPFLLVRELVLFTARWDAVEQLLSQRVRREKNLLKIHLDRKRAELSSDLGDTMFEQLYTATKDKAQVFRLNPMFIVAFEGAMGEDHGGLYRTAFSLLSEELNSKPGTKLSPRIPLFMQNEHSVHFRVVPNPTMTSPADLDRFRWLGSLFGNAVVSGAFIIPIDFPQLVWRYLAGEDLSIEEYFFDCCDSQQGALQLDEFVLDNEYFKMIPGATSCYTLEEEEELVDMSKDQLQTIVTKRREAIHFCLLHQYDQQLAPMRQGFVEVVGEAVLQEIRWRDLQRRVCGVSAASTSQVMGAMDCSALASQVTQTLREAIDLMNDEARSNFILFCSGQRRLPLPEKIKVICGDEIGKFPTAHTCSPITLVLQPYSTAEQMLQKLRTAIAHAYEFGFV